MDLTDPKWLARQTRELKLGLRIGRQHLGIEVCLHSGRVGGPFREKLKGAPQHGNLRPLEGPASRFRD